MMAETYQCILVTQTGGPEVLQVVERELRLPAPGEPRLRVLSAAVSRPDITVRAGKALYSGTPLGQKLPFTPGYAVIGEVDAVGEGVSQVVVGGRVGALTVVGGYTEILYWRSDRLIPVPDRLDPAEAVPLILNYIVAYQVLHRAARVQRGEKALIIGASGGIGTALMQLGRLSELKMYGMASPGKHHVLIDHGVVPIDYTRQNFVEAIREEEPQGLDAVLDGMMRLETICGCLSLLLRGGRLVSFGEPASRRELFRILGKVLAVNLLPNGKSFKLYGTSTYFLGNRKPYIEDWATLFRLLEAGKIKPVITAKLPLLEAVQAHRMLESGQVVGNVVLVA